MIKVGSIDDPNLQMLSPMVRALGDLRENVVFVGGCATGLLLTTIRSELIRATMDVDVVVEAGTAIDYHRVESRLRKRGFRNDLSDDAPICRWLFDGLKLDLMPTSDVLGFCNRWYALAAQSSLWCELPDSTQIRLIAGPVFLATKLEAFNDRGNNDYLASHDLEDILTVIDGRAELLDEAEQFDTELKNYLGQQFSDLLTNPNFLQALPGHLPADAGSQARLPLLLDKIRQIARL